MTVRKIINGDWSFGGSHDDYLTGDDEIIQNVTTRIKSFKDDWFLDEEAHIDWFRILGTRNNEKTIKREIYRVTQATDGVARVTKIDVVNSKNRRAAITLEFVTVNGSTFTEELSV